MEKITVRIKGITPLLMHDNKCVNPLHPIAKEIKKLTGKRKKSEEDIEQIANLEFLSGLYYDDQAGPYLPATHIDSSIRDGAKQFKKGKASVSCITTMPDIIPLIYSGSRDPDVLQKDFNFRDTRVVGVQRSSVLRTRPRFERWELEFDVHYEPKLIEAEEIKTALEWSGMYGGMGDFRPRYGKFEIVKFEIVA